VLLAVLVEARQEAGLTQRALAERLKLPRSYVSKVETGERGIDPVECVAWAKACRIDPVGLFTEFVRALQRRF
jgi:transcriptional regulator with XRE-family HTH domain